MASFKEMKKNRMANLESLSNKSRNSQKNLRMKMNESGNWNEIKLVMDTQ